MAASQGAAEEGWGGVVMGDPCIVRDDEAGLWRMFLFALPPGHAHAVCEGDPADPAAWHLLGPLEFTNPQVLGDEAAFKPFVVSQAHSPGEPALIGGRYALLIGTNHRAKVIRRAWSPSLGGPWTLEGQVLIDRGRYEDFDARHVDAVSGYFFPERNELLYFYMGYPSCAQPYRLSAFGSAQAAAAELLGGDGVRKLGPVLPPSSRPGHWASGWVGGLQLLPGREHRWIGVANASPTPPDPADTGLAAEEPPPSLGGFAWCDEPWPIKGWQWNDEPIERIESIPAGAADGGEGVNLWRHFALPLGDDRLALFYNSGDYFQEKLFLKLAGPSPPVR